MPLHLLQLMAHSLTSFMPLPDKKKPFLRRLKSFVLRQGRMTVGQQLAYDNLWSVYGVGSKLGDKSNNPETHKEVLNFKNLFNNEQPVSLEIGFGMGDSLVAMATVAKDKNFLGIEVHTPGVGRVLQQIEQQQLQNLKIFHADALEILEQQIPTNSLAAVYLFFPDPWHKRRHNKRRIVNQHFIELLYSRLHNGGLIHMATDWEDYAKYMLVQLDECIAKNNKIKLINQSSTGDYIDRPTWRPETKFERKGLKKGHGIWDILFKKVLS